PVAARVEREEPEALPEAVVDEPEVVPPEEAAAELEDDRRLLRPRQLVVEPDPVLDLCVRHGFLLDREAESLTYTGGGANPRRQRCGSSTSSPSRSTTRGSPTAR